MKKRKLALLGLAAIATLSLASCGGDEEKTSKPQSTPAGSNPSTPTGSNPSTPVDTQQSTVNKPTDIIVDYQQDTKGLDIAVNYSGKQGITLRQASVENLVENVTYVQGDLLPTWKFYGEKVKTEIREASAYSATSDNDYYTLMKNAGYKSETISGANIDLFYNSTSNINKMGAAGEAVNLLDYLEYMPNFKQFLENNPSIESAIKKDGAIYYTPYFDGYNAIERMLVMDVNMVAAVLDNVADSSFDQSQNGGANPAENVVQAGNYTPFMDDQYNLPDAETTVTISKDAKASEIVIKQAENIILQQNELLEAGCTGQTLADNFQKYLSDVYGHLVGSGKTYAKYSEIFTSESAAYNADELIALMRVVKANPGKITGDADAEIEIMVPRGVANNRVDNIADLMVIWGVQGLDGEKDMLYFDGNGKLNDGAATYQSYDGIQYLAAIYDEGLILEDFWNKGSTLGSTGYLNKYFGKTADNGGYGFMMYDYSASTGAVNSIHEGIGTSDDTRVGAFTGTAVTGVMPILPPLTYWATESNWSADNELTNHTGKTLIRYAESNRALKSNSWCIPANSDNIEKAAQLMDYLCTNEGSTINDFGPSQYWEEELGEYAGQPTPLMNDNMKAMVAASGTDFWSFLRGTIGATHGVGYVRSSSINYQATNKWAQIGTLNIENAIASNAVVLAKVDKYSSYTFDTSVPTAGYGSPTDTTSYDAVTSFWSSDKCADTASGWAAVVVGGYGNFTKTSTAAIGKGLISGNDYSLKDVYDQIGARRSVYLFTTVAGLDPSLVPSYAMPM